MMADVTMSEVDGLARSYSDRGGIIWQFDWMRIPRRADLQTRTNSHDPFHRS